MNANVEFLLYYCIRNAVCELKLGSVGLWFCLWWGRRAWLKEYIHVQDDFCWFNILPTQTSFFVVGEECVA